MRLSLTTSTEEGYVVSGKYIATTDGTANDCGDYKPAIGRRHFNAGETA